MHHSELRIACAWQRPPSARMPLQTLIACPLPPCGVAWREVANQCGRRRPWDARLEMSRSSSASKVSTRLPSLVLLTPLWVVRLWPKEHPPSTVGSLPSQPQPPRRSRPRRPGRPRSRARTVCVAAPTARGSRFPGASSRGLGWWGGAGRSSRYPSFTEDLLAGQLLRHALSDELADALFPFGSEPSEPSEPSIHILLYARGVLRRVLVFGFTRFTTDTTPRRIARIFAGFTR